MCGRIQWKHSSVHNTGDSIKAVGNLTTARKGTNLKCKKIRSKKEETELIALN